ncbi:hypothetical protein [Edaphobacter sp. DSM 109919]|uniref:Uncharacterized protein n=1 Tax=Edaphobacter paludis TaxID=3035702 RepID=A0AAU7CYC3_9BACT
MLAFAETTEVLLTHPLVPTGAIPTAHDPDGIESGAEIRRRRWTCLRAHAFIWSIRDTSGLGCCDGSKRS